MGKKKYVFDSDDFSVGRDGRKGRRFAMLVLKLFLASISLTVIYYIVFALFFSTDTERALRNENRMLERMYPEMERKAGLLDDVVEGLRVRDMKIYEDIFETDAPELDRIPDMNLVSLTDSVAEESLVMLTEAKSEKLMSGASRVEENMRHILTRLSESGQAFPPMHLPLSDFSLPMTGASVGRKMNPFYKVTGNHEGLDFMATLGAEVLAAADGTVVIATYSASAGNYVMINHGGGVYTVYMHMSSIAVSVGQEVSRGETVGAVGSTGYSTGPHLHFGLRINGTYVNPLSYVSP